MNRLVAPHAARSRRGSETALVVYLTAGDPSLAETPALLAEVARAGADVIELGVPWSDPSADGAVIQRAMERALSTGGAAHDTHRQDARGGARVPPATRTCRSCSSATTTRSAARASARVAGEARDAGVDGVLVVDLPPEESGELDDALAAAGLSRVPLLAPTTSPERARAIVARAVGLRLLRLAHRRDRRRPPRRRRRAAGASPRCARRSAALPLAVGFGVRDPASARALAPHCDAVVVGSALVQAIAEAPDAAARRTVAYERVRALKDALR